MAVSVVLNRLVLRLPYVFLVLMSVWLSILVQESLTQGECNTSGHKGYNAMDMQVR